MSIDSYYASDELLAQYCEFHYGKEYFKVPNFPKTCIDATLKLLGDRPKRKALDVGCAVGRSSFELARIFHSVDAIDYSERFIDTALKIRHTGSLDYSVVEEGDISSERKLSLDDLGLAGLSGKLSFHHGDACIMPAKLAGYDLVAAFNLLCRLPEPFAFLESVRKLTNPGGIFVLTTPCTWLEAFTKKDKWVGGYVEAGKPIRTIDGLRLILSENFNLLKEPHDIEFVIRETKRKYQHSFSQFSAWERKR